jgi:effector-binding domain-containing protein
MGYLGDLGKHPAGTPFASYNNQDMEDLEVEIGIPTAEILAGSGNIYGAEISAGKVAECVYTGPYKQMEPAYQQLTEFVAEQKLEVTGVAYEMYIFHPK